MTPALIVTIIVGIISAIIGPVCVFLFKRDVNKRDLNSKEERKTEIKKIVNEAVEPINKKLDEIDIKIKKGTDGTLSSLRNDILTCYYRCREKGYRNDYDFQNIHDLFDAYEELDGNSFIEDIMNRFDKLPVKEDVKAIDTHITKKRTTTKAKK